MLRQKKSKLRTAQANTRQKHPTSARTQAAQRTPKAAQRQETALVKGVQLIVSVQGCALRDRQNVQRPEGNARDAVQVSVIRGWQGGDLNLVIGRAEEIQRIVEGWKASKGQTGQLGRQDTHHRPYRWQADALVPRKGQSDTRTGGLGQRRRGSREASLHGNRDESTCR